MTSRKKRKQFVIGSRIRERDKKNAEYYVGDYLFSIIGIFRGDIGSETILNTFGLILCNFITIKHITN